MRKQLTRRAWRGSQVVLAVLALQTMALADCPITEGSTLFVRAPIGDLQIETTTANTVSVEISGSAIQLVENCFEDRVEIGGNAPPQIFGPVSWRIRVSRDANMDLTTFAGTIHIASTEGSVTARNTGGSIISGNIGGNAAMVTQGGSISAGNIGGDAELRSMGGFIEIGNVAGNAEVETFAGPITMGTVAGFVRAETMGGSISISESQGELYAVTLAGDILIGVASRTDVQTAGGNIIGMRIRGPFRGFTELGNIRLERAESSIEAQSGIGDIDATLIPQSIEGDLHVTLRTSSGSIRLAIPENLPANLETVMDRPVMQGPRIQSDFPLERVSSGNLPPFVSQRFTVAPIRSRTVLNGGGNSIRLETGGRGTIEIRSIRVPQ